MMDWESLLSNSNKLRDNTRIKNLVLLMKVRGKGDKNLIELFQCLSDITVKQIKNLFFLIRFEQYEFITANECISEAWIVFDRCLKGYKNINDNNFVVFYNVSLLRHFVRLKNSAYKKNNRNEKIILSSYDNETFIKLYQRSTSDDVLSFVDEDLYNIGFNIDEMRLFMSKFIICEKKKLFMKNNEDFSESKYQKVNSSMKSKIKEYAFE